MSYYTERHGMRAPVERTETISYEMYALLFACCEKYYNNIAWLYPEEYPDGQGCSGVDYSTFSTAIRFEIPTLFRDEYDRICAPEKNHYPRQQRYDQYALLDFIEFFAANCKDVVVGSFHSYFGHHHLCLLETREVFDTFRGEINRIFEKTGLLFTLSESAMVERIPENGVLSKEIESTMAKVSEQGLKGLLQDAILLYKTPCPQARQDSVEKIWDALERLKTFYTTMDKKASSTKIINDMANNRAEFVRVFEEEFRALTKIGNDFRIRHHETNKTDIADSRHYDYFFNRCLSLIALAIQYLK